MLKIHGNSIFRHSELISNNCLANGIFPSDLKKGNIVPVNKKIDKQRPNNYRPISLLPIFSRILERLTFNEMFGFFIKNYLISQRQSSFRPGDSASINFYPIIWTNGKWGDLSQPGIMNLVFYLAMHFVH